MILARYWVRRESLGKFGPPPLSSPSKRPPVPGVPTLAIVLFLALLQLIHPGMLPAKVESAEMLQRARSEKDPAKRVELLSEALKNQRLRGELLSAILYERGMAHKEMKDCFRAIEDFGSALAHSTKALPARLESAECLVQLDQLEEASRELEYYLLSKPGDARAYVIKGMIYEKEGFLSKAEDEYTRALHFDPQSTLALGARAKAYFKAGKPRQALEDADALSRLEPQNPDLFRTRAQIYVKLKDYAAALKDYDRVQSLDPGDRQIRKDKVMVYFEMGRPEKALKVLSGPSATLYDDAQVLVLLAKAHILLRNYDKADHILKRTLLKWPQNAAAHLYRGVVLVHRKQMDEALARLNRALELDPRLVEAYKERAKIFSMLGEPVRAALDLTKASDLDPADGEIVAMRALTFMKRMLYNAAIKDFTKALENLPGDPRILYDRAVAYMRVDEYESALADLNLVVERKPDAARALSLRGIARFRLREFDQAVEDLRKATEIKRNDPQLWNNLGFFFYKIGNQKDALNAINRSLQLNPKYERARYNLKLVLDREDTKIPRGHGSMQEPGVPLGTQLAP